MSNTNKRVAIISLFVYLSVTVTLITAILWNPDSFFLSYRFPAMRVWEFLLGMTLAMIPIQRKMVVPEFIPLSLVLVSPAIVVLLQGSAFSFAGPLSMTILLAIAILLLATHDTKSEQRSLLTMKWMVIGGEISYGLYLLHHGIQRYGRVIFENLFKIELKESTLTMKMIYLLSTGAISVLLAFVIWKLVEIPARSYLRKKLFPHVSA